MGLAAEEVSMVEKAPSAAKRVAGEAQAMETASSVAALRGAGSGVLDAPVEGAAGQARERQRTTLPRRSVFAARFSNL